MSNPEDAQTLAAADQQIQHLKTTNGQMVDIAADLLVEHGDPSTAIAILASQLMRGTHIESDNGATFLAQCLATVYIERAQARTESEEDR